MRGASRCSSVVSGVSAARLSGPDPESWKAPSIIFRWLAGLFAAQKIAPQHFPYRNLPCGQKPVRLRGMTTQTEEKTYEVTFHLIDGTRLTSSQWCNWETVAELYRSLGNEGGDGRVKFPMGPRNMQFIPATSILRMEVMGELP